MKYDIYKQIDYINQRAWNTDSLTEAAFLAELNRELFSIAYTFTKVTL